VRFTGDALVEFPLFVLHGRRAILTLAP